MMILPFACCLLLITSSFAWIPSGSSHRRGTSTSICISAEAAPTQFLLDRLGGEPALRATVDELYERLVADPKLFVYFDGVPIERIKQHQFDFLRIAFTEIPVDADIVGVLTNGHSRLWSMGLDETDFDSVAGHLVGTLEHLGLAKKEVDDVVEIVSPLRSIFAKDGHNENASTEQ